MHCRLRDGRAYGTWTPALELGFWPKLKLLRFFLALPAQRVSKAQNNAQTHKQDDYTFHIFLRPVGQSSRSASKSPAVGK
jgi:hypothetical protein